MNQNQNVIMEKEELIQSQQEKPSRLSKDELFEKIKNDSKSKAKDNLRLGRFFLVFGLALWVLFRLFGHDRTSDLMVPLILVISGLISLYDYWKNKKMGSFDLPEELLSWKSRQNKKDRKRSKWITCLWLVLIAYLVYKLIVDTDFKDIGFIPYILFVVAIIVLSMFMVYLSFFRGKTEKDKELERLHKLVYMD